MESEKVCKECNQTINKYNFYHHTKKEHNLNKIDYLIKHEKWVDPKTIKRECLNCHKDISVRDMKAKYCSTQCLETTRQRKQADQKYKHEVGIVECKICGIKARSLTQHLLYKHNITVQEYEEKYSVRAFSESYLNYASEKIKGENNPGFNHGGNLSPFSKNFKGYENLTDDELNKQLQSIYKKIGDSNRNNGNNKLTLKHWLKQGYSIDKAKQKIGELQRRFSLELCIDKYGEKKGKEIWLKRQEKWQKTLDAKTPEEKLEINRKKIEGRQPFSKISQELFWSVYNSLEDKTGIHFATLKDETEDKSGWNNEYVVHIQSSYSLRFLDFYDEKTNKVIEFDGDYWHGEKRGNQERDMLREQQIIDELKCEILHIQEKDYNNDKDKTIRECLEFLQS